jgi:hypothetical protein
LRRAFCFSTAKQAYLSPTFKLKPGASRAFFRAIFLPAMSESVQHERPLGNSTASSERIAKQNHQRTKQTTHRRHSPETAPG